MIKIVSHYKLQEFVLDDNGSAGDTSDDYFIKDVGAPMAYSADMTASLAMLNNMPFDAYAPNQDVNLYLGQDLLDAGFVQLIQWMHQRFTGYLVMIAIMIPL